MPTPHSFDYAVLRIVPRVDREEFINAGVILFCSERNFLDARVHLDRDRVTALFPEADLGVIEEHLLAVTRVGAGGNGGGPIGKLPPRERFHWLVAPRSTMLQVSAVHSGLTEDPKATLEKLMRELVGSAASP